MHSVVYQHCILHGYADVFLHRRLCIGLRSIDNIESDTIMFPISLCCGYVGVRIYNLPTTGNAYVYTLAL